MMAPFARSARLPVALALLGALLAGPQAWPPPAGVHCAPAERKLFGVPNPFGAQPDPASFHLIRSTESTFSAHQARRQFHVEDYFSLGAGLSFSVRREQTTHGAPASFALINDGLFGKAYVVRNLEAAGEDQDCELDHAHSSRHLFPWQYEFDLDRREASAAGRSGGPPDGILPEAGARPKGRKRRRLSPSGRTRASIYGAGAIWLNAIQRDTKSDQVETFSPYTSSNVWTMADENIEVKLLFAKLRADEQRRKPAADDAEEGPVTQAALDATPLNSIQVRTKLHAAGPSQGGESGALTSAAFTNEYLVVSSMQSGVTRDSDEQLAALHERLALCRQLNKRHRVFPSLMQSLSKSPQRLYELLYIERKYPLLRDGFASGRFDESRHRYVFERELVTEVLSLQKEAQLTVYDPLPVDGQGPGYGRTDIFLKLFAGAEAQRSSRHSTVHYHLVENEQLLESCKRGEREPPPGKPIFERPLHFHRAAGTRLSGHLSGLGALLLNAADIHYKWFATAHKLIHVAPNPENLAETREVRADEWRIYDKKSGWNLYFYFERPDFRTRKARESSGALQTWLARSRGDVSRLVRVDIRNPKAREDPFQESWGADGEALAGEQDESDLVLRYDIVSLNFELADNELEYLLTPPAICLNSAPPADNDDDGSEADDDDDNDDTQNFYYDTESDSEKLPDKDDEDDNDADDDDGGRDDSDAEGDADSGPAEAAERKRRRELNQRQAEGFELGELAENHPFPDFFELVDAQPAYSIVTRLVHDQPPGATGADKTPPKAQKAVYLEERVDLERETLELRVFSSRDKFIERQFDELYYINYASELMVRVGADARCRLVEEPEAGWLRLFSNDYSYYVQPELHGRRYEPHQAANEAVLESGRLRLFGVGALLQRAAESAQTSFVGRRKRLLELPGEEGQQFRQVSWANNEHEMRVLFDFVYSEPQVGEQTAADKKRLRRLGGLRLHAIRLSNVYDNFFDTKFAALRAELVSLEGRPAGELQVPKVCANQLIEAARLREATGGQLDKLKVRMPTFDDFVSETGAYYAKYYVTHLNRDASANLEGSAGASAKLVAEQFDRLHNRGHFLVDRGKLQAAVYVDGERRRMLAYSAELRQCKQLAHMKTLVDLGPALECANDNFDARKMYGLAELWIQLASRGPKLVRVSPRYDSAGHRRDLYSFEVTLAAGAPGAETSAASGGAGVSAHQLVRLNFVERQQLVGAPRDATWFTGKWKMRNPSELVLDSISVAPALRAGTPALKAMRNFRTTIFVETLAPIAGVEFSLPAECQALVDGKPTPSSGPEDADKPTGGQPTNRPVPIDAQPANGAQFPALANLMARVNQFHMKSEVSITNHKGVEDLVYSLDEWYHAAMVRMRARGLGGKRNTKLSFEFIYYMQSDEAFDVSQPFSCPQVLPDAGLLPGGGSSESSRKRFAQFFAEGDALVEHPAELYYGALSLWRLAQKNLANVAPVSSFELAPLPSQQQQHDERLSQLDPLDRLARDLRTEQWRVSSPSGQTKNKWSYTMSFLRHERAGDTWHTLERIEMAAPGSETQQAKALIDVINYRYYPTDVDVTRTFLLPAGWGCARAKFQEESLWDELSRESQHQVRYTYEASLELVDAAPSQGTDGDFQEADQEDANGGTEDEAARVAALSGRLAPVLDGSFWEGGRLDKSEYDIGLAVHNSRVRFPNGTLQATRTVFDTDKSLVYHIDSLTGFCTMSLVKQPYRVLDFAFADDAREQVLLDTALFDKLFRANENFHLLNRFVDQSNTVTTMYEAQLEQLQLSRNLAGPASIVYQFSHHKHELTEIRQRGNERVRLHNQMTSRVFLFDKNRSKLRAVLSLKLHNDPQVQLSDFLVQANTFQCYNDGNPDWDRELRSFTVEYPLEAQSKPYAYYQEAAIRNQFYAKLLEATQLKAFQLDGQARVQLVNHDNLMRIHFNVLEAPPAHVYFKEQVNAGMKERAMALSEFKLAASIGECSAWCDQLNCLAMAYCSDHACHVAPERTLREKFTDKRKLHKYDVDTFVSYYEPKPGCSYYWAARSKPMTLARFARFMERKVNALAASAGENQQQALARRADNPLALDLYFQPAAGLVGPSGFYASASKFRWQHEDLEPASVELDEKLAKSRRVYATLRENHAIDFAKLEPVNGDGGAGDSPAPAWPNSLVSVIVNAGSQAKCLTACEMHNCLMYSYCQTGEECSLIAETPTPESGEPTTPTLAPADARAIKKLVALIKPASRCRVMLRDYSAAYERFENTLIPAKYLVRLEGYSAAECALACQGAAEKCLSFDLCQRPIKTPTSQFKAQPDDTEFDVGSQVCYLQNTHVALDTFDKRILGAQGAANNETGATGDDADADTDVLGELNCDHYSKPVLEDYTRIPDKKLTGKLGTTVRGINVERCAIDCQTDDACLAFEHCYNFKRHPAQACYLIRSQSELLADNQVLSVASASSLVDAGVIKPSRTCSLFVTKRFALEDKLSKSYHSLEFLKQLFDGSLASGGGGFFKTLLVMLAYLVMACAIGALLQIAYIKLVGRPVTLGNYI